MGIVFEFEVATLSTPPRSGMTKALGSELKALSALTTVNGAVSVAPPEAAVSVALRFTGDSGQYKPAAVVHCGMPLSVKKFKFEPLSSAAFRSVEPLKAALTKPVLGSAIRTVAVPRALLVSV